MKREGLRVVLAGASGALGRELVQTLQARGFPVSELYPFATERSLPSDVEFGDDVLAVETVLPPLPGYDLMFICTPRGVALDLVREALRAELPCIDCSGALVRSSDVPLGLADRSPAVELVGAPVIAAPSGPALAWGRVLAALEDLAGLVRVTGTVLQSASRAGAAGVDSLSDETIALLSAQEQPPLGVFPTEVAFDCVPRSLAGVGAAEADDGVEGDLVATVARLVGRAVPLAASIVQVPAFVGEGSSLFVELAQQVDPGELLAELDKVPGIERFSGGGGTLPGPSMREVGGSDQVLIGSLRRDPSSEQGVALWVVADPICLAASNAVKLAEARTHLH